MMCIILSVCEVVEVAMFHMAEKSRNAIFLTINTWFDQLDTTN